MNIIFLAATIVGLNLAWSQIKTRWIIRRRNYKHDAEKYMRAWQERRRHEERYGEENAVTHFRLQELIRIEVGALSILRNYYPAESSHLEISLRVLVKRLDDAVIY